MTIGNIGNCPYAIFGVGAKKGLDMNNQIELCLEIAVAAHKGQLDKVGLPVILHPLHVGEMGSCEDEICVGFLHDVIEDTSLNGEDLLAKGVARSIVESVLVLTHDKTKTYFEYIQCIIDSHNKTAIAVKLNDLKHNYERSLKYGFDEQNQKCKKAIAMILFSRRIYKDNMGNIELPILSLSFWLSTTVTNHRNGLGDAPHPPSFVVIVFVTSPTRTCAASTTA